MEIVIHAGVHCTDKDRLLKGVLRNADLVRNQGVAIPGPSRYREFLRQTLTAVAKSAPGPDARDIVLDGILDQEPDQVSRLVLSNEHFFCVPKMTFGGGLVYRWAEQRLQAMCALFPQDDIHLFLGLRDPATYLPAVYADTPHETFNEFMAGVDPMDMRWSDLFRRIRHDAPNVRITSWCNEDTPLIWGPLMRAMIGLAEGTKINGSFDLLHDILDPEGMRRFRAFLKEHPSINEAQKRKVMIAFLDKYAMDEALEEELDMPGWDDDYVEDLTEIYEEDVALIMQMDGVRFLTP